MSITNSNVKRILTLKSKLGFGKYGKQTIADIINIGKNAYLRWVYFNYSNIDFMPDILDTIQIDVEYRLEKPGKKPEVLDEVNSKVEEKHKFVFDDSKEAKEKRAKVLNTMKAKQAGFVSKSLLLRKNHGHR